MIFAAQDGDVRGPPRFGVVGRARAWGIVLKKSHEAVKGSSEPRVQDPQGGPSWGGDYEVLDDGEERLSVCVVLPEARGVISLVFVTGPQPNSLPPPAERPGAGRVFLAFPAPAPGPGRSPCGPG